MHKDLPSPLQLLVETLPDRARLVVFSDDWGRHPSSAQHLIRQLLPRYQVDWVNTVGTHRPRLSLGDFRRAVEKLKGMGRRFAGAGAGGGKLGRWSRWSMRRSTGRGSRLKLSVCSTGCC